MLSSSAPQSDCTVGTEIMSLCRVIEPFGVLWEDFCWAWLRRFTFSLGNLALVLTPNKEQTKCHGVLSLCTDLFSQRRLLARKQ